MIDFVVHEEEYLGLTIKIIQDTDSNGNDPMDWDMLGKQMYWHRRSNLGHDYKTTQKYSPEEWLRGEVGEHLNMNNCDVYSKKYEKFDNMTMEELMEEFEKYNLVIPVHAYEHGGITISASGCRVGWNSFDSSQLGFVYVSHEDILKNFGKKKLSKKMLERAKKILIQEVSIYDDYLIGNVWGYKISDEFENNLDNCWGFLGNWKYCLKDAKSQAKYFAEEQKKLNKELDKRMMGK